ncbi:MAG: hypothetical protein V8R40_10965 [Dysosmobacter sp.]
MLYQYEQYDDAENGNSLVLTLDRGVQAALEKGLSSMITKFDAAKGGTGIIMDVKTGAILAMASYPTHDPNSYGTLYDEKLQSQLDSQLAELAQNRADYETEEDYQAAVSAAKSSVLEVLSGATSASTPPMSPAPPSSPSPWPRPWRRAWWT